MESIDQNIFTEQPEFIDTDSRKERPERLAYRIDSGFMYLRHKIMLPGHVVENKTILDLGSCNAATGAWCLSHGAKSYTGVEFQNAYDQSKLNLSKYYSPERWNIMPVSIEEFVAKCEDHYDVVIALGVVHAFTDVLYFLNKIAAMTDFIVIDGTHPYTIHHSPYFNDKLKAQLVATPDYIRFIENEPFIAMYQTGMSLQSKKSVMYDGFVPSMGILKQILIKSGFAPVPQVNEMLKEQMPNVYSPRLRFGINFTKIAQGQRAIVGLAANMSSEGKVSVVNWEK